MKKLISDSDMDVAKASYMSAKAGYDQANATLKQFRDQFSQDDNLFADGRRVSQLISELGERVSGSTFTQGTEIMTIADLSSMEARVDVGENDVGHGAKRRHSSHRGGFISRSQIYRYRHADCEHCKIDRRWDSRCSNQF